MVIRFGILPSPSSDLLYSSERFVKLLTYQLLVNKVWLATGVKERGLQKRGILMKYG